MLRLALGECGCDMALFSQMSLLYAMSIFHHMRLCLLSHFLPFEHQAQRVTRLAAPRLEAEDVFPEVVRCQDLHQGKQGVVHCRYEEQKGPERQVSKEFLVSHDQGLDDAKEEHLHEPRDEVSWVPSIFPLSLQN